ncbi:transcriptional repressor NrdR [Candidatus Micrarchaeota archaeon]|nr:transcriptional repressor NrdR [Candidatus Micrarchaeota archaeon]
MKCPYCNHAETSVMETRESEDLAKTRRRRECDSCAKRFTTYERIENIELSVIKKDGRREEFDRSKVLAGLLKACEKRPVQREALEQVVDEVERELRNKESTEISSSVVGELVMTRLRVIDKVAFVRFASVYRNFEDVSSFEEEARALKREDAENGKQKPVLE